MRKVTYDPYSSLNQKLIDAFMAGSSFLLACQLHYDGHIPGAFARQLWLLLPLVALGQVVISGLLGGYRMIWRYIGLSDAVTLARNQAAFSVVFLILALVVAGDVGGLRVAPGIIVMHCFFSLQLSLGVRALRRLQFENFLYKISHQKHGSPVLLVGAGRAGVMVARELESRADIKPVGFVDDDPKKKNSIINRLRVLGPLSSIPSIVQDEKVQQIIICIPQLPQETLRRIWALSESFAVNIKIVPTLEEILQGNINISAFRDVNINDLLGRDTVDVSSSGVDLRLAYEDKRILVTGAGGSIGSELAYQLSKLKPEHLILLDKDENGLHDTWLRIKAEDARLHISPVVADIRSPERMEAIFSSFLPEIVFHAAAHKHVHLMEANPCEAVLNNVIGTRNLVDLSIEFGVARFVMISTDKAVKPTSVMGASKRLCEMIVQSQHGQKHTQFSCVRFGNVLGSSGSVIPIFQKQIARGGPITVTHPEVERFLMTISEAVSLVIQAGTLASHGEIFVLDMGKPILIRNLARDFIEMMGMRPGKDIKIEITHLTRGEKLREALVDEETETLHGTHLSKVQMISSAAFDISEFQAKIADLERAAHRESISEVYRIFQLLNIGFSSQENTLIPDGREAVAAATVGIN